MTKNDLLLYSSLIDRKAALLAYHHTELESDDSLYARELAKLDSEIYVLREKMNAGAEENSPSTDEEEDEEGAENEMTLEQAIRKVCGYNFEALKKSFASMSIPEIMQEVKEVGEANAILQQQPEIIYFNAITYDFNAALAFLGNFCMGYLTHIYFNVHY